MLNAAPRVVSGIHKFEYGLSRLLHTKLHWLNVPEARDTRANIDGRQCWLSFWQPTITADTEARNTQAYNVSADKNDSQHCLPSILARVSRA